MKNVILSFVVVMSSSLAMAQGNTVGACVDKVLDAAEKQISSSLAGGEGNYALQSVSILNRFEGISRIEDAKQDIVVTFETSDSTGRKVQKFGAKANTKCEFNLIPLE